jgi:ketosteroid isomerase-like protein
MEEIIRDYIAAYNHFDVQGMIRHLSDDVVFQNVSEGEVTLELYGKEAFKKQAELANKLFKSRKQTIDDIQIEGNTAEVAINYEGFLAQDLPSGLKAGNTLHLRGKSIFTFSGEKIVKLQDKI